MSFNIDALVRQHQLMFGESLVPPNKPNPAPLSIERCFKCQGLGQTPSDCPNKEFITLAEWEAAMEVELEEKNEEKNGDVFEEVVIEADESEILSVDTHHPPRSNESLELLSTFHEPPTLSPTPKALKQNFCQLILEPLLKAPNFQLRAYKELVQSMCEQPPSCTIQISKGRANKNVSKFKRDLFTWMILFQPELN